MRAIFDKKNKECLRRGCLDFVDEPVDEFPPWEAYQRCILVCWLHYATHETDWDYYTIPIYLDVDSKELMLDYKNREYKGCSAGREDIREKEIEPPQWLAPVIDEEWYVTWVEFMQDPKYVLDQRTGKISIGGGKGK